MASRRSYARATTPRPPTADAGPHRGMQRPELRDRLVAPHGADTKSASGPPGLRREAAPRVRAREPARPRMNNDID